MMRLLCRVFGHKWTYNDVPDYCPRCGEIALYWTGEEPPGWRPVPWSDN